MGARLVTIRLDIMAAIFCGYNINLVGMVRGVAMARSLLMQTPIKLLGEDTSPPLSPSRLAQHVLPP
jgi:hypothetical protein